MASLWCLAKSYCHMHYSFDDDPCMKRTSRETSSSLGSQPSLLLVLGTGTMQSGLKVAIFSPGSYNKDQRWRISPGSYNGDQRW